MEKKKVTTWLGVICIKNDVDHAIPCGLMRGEKYEVASGDEGEGIRVRGEFSDRDGNTDTHTRILPSEHCREYLRGMVKR